jgi:hypothetical protein
MTACRLLAWLGIGGGLMLSACAQQPTPPAVEGDGEVNRLAAAVRLAEPGASEVVVVINDNPGVSSHAGMFAGTNLYDPAGTYRGTRPLQNRAWRGPTLRDYLAYQLRDGPAVQVFRFTLSPTDFTAIATRAGNAGWTLPLFCATSVQDILVGIGPFQQFESVWWTSPRRLGAQLGQIVHGYGMRGRCEMPDAHPC